MQSKPFFPKPASPPATRNQVQIGQPLPTAPPSALSQNRLARAYASADPRQNVKARDRAGVSRGRGAWNDAGIRAAESLSSGLASAYDAQLSERAQDANANLQLQQGQEQFGQALGALNQQVYYDDQMAALQSQGALYGLMG